MVRRGVNATPRDGRGEQYNAFTESLRRNNIRPFQQEFHMNNNNTNTAAQMNESLNAAAAAETLAAAEALREQADQMEAAARDQAAKNDTAEAGPSNILDKVQNGSKFKTFRKVLGWTLGVGVVAAGGLYVVSKLREMGADVGDDVVEAIEGAGDTIADAIAG